MVERDNAKEKSGRPRERGVIRKKELTEVDDVVSEVEGSIEEMKCMMKVVREKMDKVDDEMAKVRKIL